MFRIQEYIKINRLALGISGITATGIIYNICFTERKVDESSVLKLKILKKNDPSIWKAVQMNGGSVIHNVLSGERLEYWHEKAINFCEKKGTEVVSAGRWHWSLLETYRSGKDKDLLKQVDFLQNYNFKLLIETVFVEKNVVLTELQLLKVKAQSKPQFFHVDNNARGLTVLIALDDIVEKRGPTQIMLGTHKLFDESGKFQFSHLQNIITSFSLSELNIVKATVPVGSAVILDSRTIHRGLGNSDVIDRPMLVLRWDSVDTIAPGMGIIGTNFVRMLASFLNDYFNLLFD